MKHLFLSLLLLTLLFPFIKIPASADAQTPTLFFCVGTNAKPPCAQPPVSPSVAIASPAAGNGASPSISANPSISPSTSQTPSTNPSTSPSSTPPCSTSQSSVSSQSTGTVTAMHFGKRHFSGNRGGLQQFFQLLLQLLQLLFQQLGIQFPTGPCPSPSTAPSPSAGGNNPSPSTGAGGGNNPSPSTGAGGGNNPSPSTGAGGGNNPSPSTGAGGGNNPSPSTGAGGGNNPSPSTGAGGGTQKDSFVTPTKLTGSFTSTGTGTSQKITITVTWVPVTKTTQGKTASPTSYSLVITKSDGTTGIGGISNTSVAPLNQASKYCTTSLCTQTFSITNSSNNTAQVTAISSGTTIVKVYAVATSTIAASATAKATVTKSSTTAACKSPAPDVVGDDYKTAESTLSNAGYKPTLTNGSAGNIISQKAGSTSCSEIIETDNIATPTTPQCSTSATQSTRCVATTCKQPTTGKAGAYCETNTVHHNGTGGSYVPNECPGGANFECWVPGATSSNSPGGSGGVGGTGTTCTSLGGVCTPTQNLPITGGFTVLSGATDCTSSQTCIKETCTGAGNVCLATGTTSKSLTHESIYDKTCSTDSSILCYKVNSTTIKGSDCQTAQGICLAGGTISKSLIHISGTNNVNDNSCSPNLCYKVEQTQPASVPNSAVAASTVNQTATAAPNLWTTITTGIWHVLTSL